MANPYFKFKQFTVYHHLCAMKVGMDGVLLGAWAPVSIQAKQRMLDIGSGSGLIALMLAQRSEAIIDAIDIDHGAFLQTSENFEASPWKDRLNAMEGSLQDFKPGEGMYDLIVTNPPYFINSLKSPEKERNLARHNSELPHDELLNHSARLLKKTGRICLILPVNEAEQLLWIAPQFKLCCYSRVMVYPKPGVPCNRMLLELGFEKRELVESSIVLELERHVYSPEFSSLAKEFYLKL